MKQLLVKLSIASVAVALGVRANGQGNSTRILVHTGRVFPMKRKLDS